MSRQPGQASGSYTKDLGGGKVLMRQKRVLARFLAVSLSFRFLILKVGTLTFPFMTSSVTQWPLIIGSLGSEACPGWWKQHMVAEPEAESPQYHPAPELVRTLSLHQSRLRTEKFFFFFFLNYLFGCIGAQLQHQDLHSVIRDLSLQHTDCRDGETLILKQKILILFLQL